MPTSASALTPRSSTQKQTCARTDTVTRSMGLRAAPPPRAAKAALNAAHPHARPGCAPPIAAGGLGFRADERGRMHARVEGAATRLLSNQNRAIQTNRKHLFSFPGPYINSWWRIHPRVEGAATRQLSNQRTRASMSAMPFWRPCCGRPAQPVAGKHRRCPRHRRRLGRPLGPDSDARASPGAPISRQHACAAPAHPGFGKPRARRLQYLFGSGHESKGALADSVRRHRRLRLPMAPIAGGNKTAPNWVSPGCPALGSGKTSLGGRNEPRRSPPPTQLRTPKVAWAPRCASPEPVPVARRRAGAAPLPGHNQVP